MKSLLAGPRSNVLKVALCSAIGGNDTLGSFVG